MKNPAEGAAMADDRAVPRIRLGVALLLPARPAAEVDVLRRALGGGDAVRHIPPHLTLVPPINVREERLEDVERVIRRAAAGARPISATLGPPASFLPTSPVLHLAVGPGEAVTEVKRLRDAVSVEPMARDLAWPFVPHVTLLDGGDRQRIAAAVEALAGHVVDVTFGAVTLLREQRDEDGVRVWRPVLDASLGGPSVVARGGLELELEVGERLDRDAATWFELAWDAHDRDLAGEGWTPAEQVAVTARREGAVVGAATGVCRDGEVHLERLIVDPAVRGEGIGTHLLAAFTSDVVDRGAGRVVARTIAGGAAQRFYVERGFTVVATLPRWRRGADFALLERAFR